MQTALPKDICLHLLKWKQVYNVCLNSK
uniref:Uncharacterized protein n=1 Tax=Arundo donax TaxID=35708 RepID=A0A0A9B303_ARUDO